MIAEMIQCLLSGMCVGFMAFLKILPIFDELGNLKIEIIAAILGVPIAVISGVFITIKLIKKIRN